MTMSRKMKIFRNIHIFITFMMMTVITACNDQFSEFSHNYKKDEILVATIAGSEPANARASISSIDNWSYTRFNDVSDKIGFYSLYGNLDAEGGNGPFYNEPMEFAKGEAGSRDEDKYWKGVFRPINMNYDVGLIKNDPRSTFVYFPYTDRMEKEGMVLRIKMDDDSYRCVDALAISSINDKDNEAIMSGTFNHTFSEIVIIRGYGFDSPPEGKDEIKVVTTLPYSHAKVVDNENNNHSDWKILKPIYDSEHTSLSEQECREWVAWKGADYEEGDKKIPAKYVIIPTAISGDRSTINYIELYDNNGTLHKVTTFGLLSDKDKRVSPNERYWLTIKLEGLVPTIYPFAITPWAEETRYTEQRARGINTAEEFMQFVINYNSYNDYNRSEYFEEKLETFGDKYIVNNDVGWHFHINNDIDLSDLITVENFNISTLRDTIDGRTNTLRGLKSSKAFITELKSNGCIRNLNIIGLNVTNTSDSVTGGVINKMTGGLITGCNVDGYVNANGNGNVGLAVGQFTAGTISNSSFSGLVVGSSSYDSKGLIGLGPSEGFTEGMLKGINTSGLIFSIGN